MESVETAKSDLEKKRPARRAGSLRVGLTFNLRRVTVAEGDTEAEFDSQVTIDALSDAIRAQSSPADR